jgi:hypothetical protein
LLNRKSYRHSLVSLCQTLYAVSWKGWEMTQPWLPPEMSLYVVNWKGRVMKQTWLLQATTQNLTKTLRRTQCR